MEKKIEDIIVKYMYVGSVNTEGAAKEICDLFNINDSYKKKLRALLEGLEAQHIDKFMTEGKIGDYRNYGKAYIGAFRDKIDDSKD